MITEILPSDTYWIRGLSANEGSYCMTAYVSQLRIWKKFESEDETDSDFSDDNQSVNESDGFNVTRITKQKENAKKENLVTDQCNTRRTRMPSKLLKDYVLY